MNELEQARAEIDAIDAQMAELFARRMHAAAQIAAWKQQNGLPVYDPAREQAVLARTQALIREPALRADHRAFQTHTVALCREYQQRLLAANDPTLLRVSLPQGGYDVHILPGGLTRTGTLFALARRVLVVTDEGVPACYAQALAAQCETAVTVTVPQGERSKSLAQYERLLLTLQTHGFTRDDCVVAVGGGVVGDLAGFTAASYLRGIDFYNVPTTLLAQVDAGVGGKTGLDLGGVKNRIGAFWQPKGVLIDPALLQTLPPRHRANGLAEALKMGLVADPALFALLERGAADDDLPEILWRALAAKCRIVAQDERDRAARRLLNFGHTIGHGLEAVTALLHGECVALGMLPMCQPPLRARLLPILRRLGLPTQVQADAEAVFAAMLHDKKSHNCTVDAVFVDDVGCARIVPTTPAELRDRLLLLLRGDDCREN